MSHWEETLDIRAAWRAAKDKEMSVSYLAGIIATKLPNRDWDSDLTALRDDFLAMQEEGNTTPDEFDDVWERFYDWADANRMWVKR